MPEVAQRRDVPLCEPCADRGRCAIGVHDLRAMPDGTVRGRFVVPPDARGRVVAHGGWIAWVFDEVLGLLPEAHGEWAVTSELNIRYRRPVPVGACIEAVAWLDSADGSVRVVHGHLGLADTEIILASATGRWVVLDEPEKHYARARQWADELVGR